MKLKPIVSLEENPMQSDEIRKAHVVSTFLMTARRYFGLAPAAQSMARRGGPYGRLRPVFRSLLVAGSLGTVLAQPVFAMETMRSYTTHGATKKSAPKRETASPGMPGALVSAEEESSRG